MSASNAQNTTQSSPIREPPEPTSPPSHEENQASTRRDVIAIVHDMNEDLIRRMNVDFEGRMNATLDEAFRRLNLLPHESEPPTSPQTNQPHITIPTTSIRPIQTPISATTPTPVLHTRTKANKPNDIGYFDPKPYAESTVLDSENGPTIHDVYLFINRTKRNRHPTNAISYESTTSISTTESTQNTLASSNQPNTSMDETYINSTNHGIVVPTKLPPPYKTSLLISLTPTTWPSTIAWGCE